MKNKDTFQTRWQTCFDQFKQMGKTTQQIMRNCAIVRLIENGAEEVGSSDVSHSLFAMWEQAGNDWQKAIVAEVNKS